MIRKTLAGKYLAISGTALLLYALVGFIVAPRIIRWYMPQYAQEALHCRVQIDKVRINPFLLTVEVNGFSLKHADGSQPIAFAKLFVDLETSSLFHRAVVLRELSLDKPDIRATVGLDGSIDLKRLATAVAQTPKPGKSDATLLPFILRDVTIRGGRIAVVDRRQSIPADFTLSGLDLQLQDLFTANDHYGTYSLAATTEAGESLQGEGELSLSPLRSNGRLTLSGVGIAGLWQFFRDSTNLEQPAGRIDVATGYRLDADTSPVRLTLENLRVTVADLSLKLLDADYTVLQLKKIELDAPRFDPATKKLHAKNLLFDEGAVDVRIDTSGKINLQRIIEKYLVK
ncbi:MAG: protein of unknown function DUF748 [uncultured bacterium]|nr:MAG: protein of unknown function DUF748 [uncultured bacterium]